MQILSFQENVINVMVADGLRSSMEHVISNDGIHGAVLISGKPNSFVAGADIGMLARVWFFTTGSYIIF